MPKVSIIVPVYNVENYIKDTVKSIQNQTLKEIEIILVDDGSTDKSGKYCEELKRNDDRINVIHQKRQGVSVARNTGMDIATGEYIGFADADDLMEKDMYETLYQNAIENKADLSLVSPTIRMLNGNEVQFNGTKKRYLWDNKEALNSFFSGKVFNIAVYTKLLKKELADKIRFQVGKAIHEDKYFTYEAIKNADRIFFEDTCKYIYIKRENSASTSDFSKKKFDAVYLADKILEDISLQNDEQLFRKAYIDTYKTKLLILRGIYRDKNAKKNFSTEKRQLINQIKQVDIKKYLKGFSKQTIIEIYIIQKFTPIYGIVVKLFDLLFKEKR